VAEPAVIRNRADLERLRTAGLARLYPRDLVRVNVGTNTCGLACGADRVVATLERELAGADVMVRHVGCLGLCSAEPLVDVLVPGLPRVVYGPVGPEMLGELVAGIRDRQPALRGALCKLSAEELVIENREQPLGAADMPGVVEYREHPFFAKQKKIALRNCGFIDPTSLEEYVARGGYQALAKVLEARQPEQVIQDVIRSGLRGRGGGGFPTGWKWAATREAAGDIKYVICNADEGDPGAYMDRSVMEGDPHAVIEGMLIGAYAIGAAQGCIYIRTEYPLAVARVEQALATARAYGLLGRNILGSGFDFDIFIARGSGAFVCGESSALIASVEGNPGEPRAKHIHMSESGLWGRPTTLNNVETWANIPVIVSRGPEWFAAIGTKRSTGTKVFSVVGNVKQTGLVEVPMGMPLIAIVNDIAGGVPEGRTLKAVQTGGPSGGCLPAGLLHLPVDFDSLTEAGSMMGSGGMIVMDSSACMVDVARYFVEFLVDESCGKCSSCREGLKHLHAVLRRICSGEGRETDLELLEDLCDVVANASLCGLGTSAPNPVLSTLRYFRAEYEAHIRERRCPAQVCRALLRYVILAETCTGCGACRRKCPVRAITGEPRAAHAIDQARCIKCGQCREVCKFNAVSVT